MDNRRNYPFGIEIEFTGISRKQVATVMAEYFGTTVIYNGGSYGEYAVNDSEGRKWKVVYDGSIYTETRNRNFAASGEYSCELVSPILTYENDIERLQELVRKLRKAGAFVNTGCGIHIHLDGAKHTARSLKNFINLIAGRDDLLYKALQVNEQRQEYCKKLDNKLVTEIKSKKPQTIEGIRELWYRVCDPDGTIYGRDSHYNHSRYHVLNLHSYFCPTGNHTIELRFFNSTLHAVR
jgi:hypothetical protein